VTAAVQQLFNADGTALNLERSETKAVDRDGSEIGSTTLYVPLPVVAAVIVFAAETAAKTIGKKPKHSEFLVVPTGILKHPAMFS
jgi:hypothetical protein